MFDVTPVTSRREADCGPTCLKMLLAYYGIDVPLDQLIAECGENVWGCTAKDLMVAGGLHGLGMTAYHVDADELLGLDRPSIIWWRRNHWCVLCGVRDDGRVEICQPDRGKFSVSKGSFESLYAGVALFNGDPMDGIPAEDNYAVGQLFELGGTIYRATQAIARGECVRAGHNAEAVTVTDVINQINSESEE